MDAVIATGLLVVAYATFGMSLAGPWGAAYVVVVGGSLALRRVAPGVAAALVGAAGAVLIAVQALGLLGPLGVADPLARQWYVPVGITALAVCLVGYSVTVHRPLWMSLVVLGLVALGASAELAVLAVRGDEAVRSALPVIGAWAVAPLAVAWGLGAVRVVLFSTRDPGGTVDTDVEPSGPRDLGGRWDAWLRAHEVEFDRVLAVGFAAVCVVEGAAVRGWTGAVLSAALTLPLVWRRTRPVLMLGCVAAAALAQWTIDVVDLARQFPSAGTETVVDGDPAGAVTIALPTTAVPLLADLSVFLVVYAVSAYASRRVARIALVLALVGAVLETGLLNAYDLSQGTVASFLFAAPFAASAVLAAWAFGSLRRARWTMVHDLQERARLLEVERDQHARLAAAAERARIAREMHDVVAHSLAVVIAQADGGRYAARARPEAAQEVLETIGTTARQALTEMRQLLGVLREEPPVKSVPAVPQPSFVQSAVQPSVQSSVQPWPTDPVLEAALATEPVNAPQPQVSDVPALVERLAASGLTVQLTQEGSPRTLPAGAGLAVYRIVQEGLTNVLKHAGPAARAQVRLAWTPQAVEIDIVDDGRGAAARPAEAGGGHGLVGMRERAALYGGRVDAGPVPGGGFAVRAVLPVQTRPDDRLVEA